jgi:hypothetical protein
VVCSHAASTRPASLLGKDRAASLPPRSVIRQHTRHDLQHDEGKDLLQSASFAADMLSEAVLRLSAACDTVENIVLNAAVASRSV